MAKGDKITYTLALEKVTKGAIRYQEITADGTPISIDEGAKVGSQYVRKSALDGDAPQRLHVEITVE